MQDYKGSCHCGAVAYDVQGDFTAGMRCNCSHCSRKAFLLAFVPASQFTLLRGEDMLTLYQFNKKHIDHLFCKICGVQSFSRGKRPDGESTVAINLNCLEDFDTSKVAVQEYDGKSM